jgi:pyruvate carboxylase subunit B
MRLKITETVLRDGQQSHIATRMRTEDMIPIAQRLDDVGFYAAEVWGGATYDACILYLREDPWERLRILRRLMPKTKLMALIRGQTLVGYRHSPDDVVEAFITKAAENGIDIFRIFDILDDLRNCETAVRAVRAAGKTVEGSVFYSISPIHNIDHYVQVGRRWRELGASSIALQDTSGIMTPQAADSVIQALKKEVGLPVHLHCHSLGGMAPMAYLKAVEAGVDSLDTAISSFSSGTSLPATESIVAAFRGTDHDTGLQLEALDEINEHFLRVKQKYQQFMTQFSGVDVKVLRHQMPGGMVSNLEQQLKDQKALDKLPLVFKEVPAVRRDLGYVFLATPFSQMIGTQAVLNVITGERYKVIIKEIVEYLKGMYGKPPGPINEELLKKALKGEEPITCRPADLLKNDLERLRQELGSKVKTPEDLLTYALFPRAAPDFFRERRTEDSPINSMGNKPLGP